MQKVLFRKSSIVRKEKGTLKSQKKYKLLTLIMLVKVVMLEYRVYSMYCRVCVNKPLIVSFYVNL